MTGVIAVGLLGVLIAAPIAVALTPPDAEPRALPTAVATPDPFAAGGLQDPATPAQTIEVGVPVAVHIPRIGVSSTLEDLTVGASGELIPPVDFSRAGWYVDGPAPGELGPAIIAGHVDSRTGPAVFHRLGELRAGDKIIVDTDDGRSLSFTVTTLIQSAKATFPTAAVYSNVPRPELRVITCAGYDPAVGHYADNLIVFASRDAEGSEPE